MAFGHEKLDVYRAAIEYVGWAYRYCEGLKGHRNSKDHLLRASQAIPLNIAERNGKGTDGDRANTGRVGSTPIPIPTPTPMNTGRTRSQPRLALDALLRAAQVKATLSR